MLHLKGSPKFDEHHHLVLAHGKNWDDGIDLFQVQKSHICYYVGIGGNDKEVA
jgi:hypothetical protein